MTTLLEALTMFDQMVEQIGAQRRAPTEKEKAALDKALLLHAKAVEGLKAGKKEGAQKL